jgi:hypothetical protein
VIYLPYRDIEKKEAKALYRGAYGYVIEACFSMNFSLLHKAYLPMWLNFHSKN